MVEEINLISWVEVIGDSIHSLAYISWGHTYGVTISPLGVGWRKSIKGCLGNSERYPEWSFGFLQLVDKRLGWSELVSLPS